MSAAGSATVPVVASLSRSSADTPSCPLEDSDTLEQFMAWMKSDACKQLASVPASERQSLCDSLQEFADESEITSVRHLRMLKDESAACQTALSHCVVKRRDGSGFSRSMPLMHQLSLITLLRSCGPPSAEEKERAKSGTRVKKTDGERYATAAATSAGSSVISTEFVSSSGAAMNPLASTDAPLLFETEVRNFRSMTDATINWSNYMMSLKSVALPLHQQLWQTLLQQTQPIYFRENLQKWAKVRAAAAEQPKGVVQVSLELQDVSLVPMFGSVCFMTLMERWSRIESLGPRLSVQYAEALQQCSRRVERWMVEKFKPAILENKSDASGTIDATQSLCNFLAHAQHDLGSDGSVRSNHTSLTTRSRFSSNMPLEKFYLLGSAFAVFMHEMAHSLRHNVVATGEAAKRNEEWPRSVKK
jgi:hypothetical protein